MTDDETVEFSDGDDRHSLPRLPGYDVLEFIGQGGHSIVYRARQSRLNRDVAIRTNRSGVSGPRASQWLLREAKILASIQHPHVVSILDCLHDRERCYLVLEFVAGGSLAWKLNGQRQHPVLAGSLVERLARTVHSIHDCGITHCNLKPGNVLLAVPPSSQEHAPEDRLTCEDVYGIPLISSFGLALDDERRATLQDGEVFGNPAYMAPEQVAGRCHAIGPASDVYALGAILYTMLTGHPPFRAQATNYRDLLSQVMEREPEPVSRLNPAVDERMDAICRTCLARQPESRYATALELARTLRDYVEQSRTRG